MSTTGIGPVVEAIVTDYVQKGNMFTAHDVTLETRQKGHRLNHNEVRDTVHDYYSRGGMGVAYTRSVISVPAGGQPFLYHRTADDPATYGNIRGQGMVPNASTATIAVPPPSSIPVNTDDDDDDEDDDEPVAVPAGLAVKRHKSRSANKNKTVDRAVDSRESLSIPKAMVHTSGFKPGDKVYASGKDDNGTWVMEITSFPTSANVCKKYTVDKNGQIRITQSALKRANIGGSTYDVVIEQNTSPLQGMFGISGPGGKKILVKLHK